jgi:hypothetical protein
MKGVVDIDMDNLDNDDCKDVDAVRENYALAACALTVPFRTLQDLKGPAPQSISWWSAWILLRDGTDELVSPDGTRVMEPAVLIKVTNVDERFLQFQEEYHHDRCCAAIIDPAAQSSQWSLSLAGGQSHDTGADQSHLDFGHLKNEMEVITEATLKKNDEIKAH